MRIKKTSATTSLPAQVVNTYNTSDSDTYSCDYLNNKVDGKLLWQNPSPNSSFSSQTISNIDLSDYAIVEIYCTRFGTGTSSRKLLCFKTLLENSLSQLYYCDYDNGVRAWNRDVTFTNNSILFDDCYINGTITNTGLIPYKVIGYK